MESTECTAQTWGSYPEIQIFEYKYIRLSWKVQSVLRKPRVVTLKYRTLNISTQVEMESTECTAQIWGSYTEIQNIEYKDDTVKNKYT